MKDAKIYDGSGWQSLKGPPGPSEPSKDAGNEITKGSDGLLLAPYRGLEYLHWDDTIPPLPQGEGALELRPLLWLNTSDGSLWWRRAEDSSSGQAWEPVLDRPVVYSSILEGEDGSQWQSRYTRTLSGDVTLIVNSARGQEPAVNTLFGLPYAADTAYPGGDPWTFFGKALIDVGGGGSLSIVPVTINTGEDWLTFHVPASATDAYLIAVEIAYRASEITYR